MFFIKLTWCVFQILGLLIAAHDTAATAIIWGLKFLADHPSVQTKLRESLRTGHSLAVSENRVPTSQEIINTSIHYRDAAIEEIIRCSHTESALIRTTLTDISLLGHRIPKGTDVFFMGNGPSVANPAFPIDDSLRSETFHAAGKKESERYGEWSAEDIGEFKPERWLRLANGPPSSLEKGGEGEVMVFDPTAGPLLTFGLGERGCYGKKMAYVEMKLFLTLLVWEFELGKCPESLSSYAAADKLVHAPQQCFVRLKRATMND